MQGVTLQREADLRGPLGHSTGGKVCVGTLNPEDWGGTSGFIHDVSTIDNVVGNSCGTALTKGPYPHADFRVVGVRIGAIIDRLLRRVGQLYHRFYNSRPTAPIKHV